MTENAGQRGGNGFSASDETLRLYLLCRLGEDERLRLDERLLVDDEFAEQMQLAESELTDDFVAGRLDSDERESFERSFLTTESRRKKLHFASALHDYAASQTPSSLSSPVAQQEKTSWLEGLTGLFTLGGPRAWAIVFAVLVLLVGLAWFVARQRHDTVPVVTRNEPNPTLSPEASPPAEASPQALISPAPSMKPVPTPAGPAAPATVASFVLLPGALRDGGDMTRIAVPGGERDVVRLSLILEIAPSDIYRAEVTTVDGQIVTIRNKLKADSRSGDPKVIIDIPARLLQSGDYQIKLTRQKADGQLEAVGSYYFRALE